MISLYPRFCQSLIELDGVGTKVVLAAGDHADLAPFEDGAQFFVFEEGGRDAGVFGGVGSLGVAVLEEPEMCPVQSDTGRTRGTLDEERAPIVSY